MKKDMITETRRQWTAPTLTFVGTVGDILNGGGGKLSITSADPGENRCEKPHAEQCAAGASRK